MTERIALIEKASALGFDPEELIRLPTYAIVDKLKSVKQEPEIKLQDDDAQTIIDMPNFENPGDENFARLQFLLETQKGLRLAIDANSNVLEKCVKDFEKDDIVALRKEIDCAQTHLRYIEPELKSLKMWFAEQRAQKLEFYKTIAPTCVDTSGELSNHFRNKMVKMDAQLKSLHIGESA
jgi:cytochrome c551/c552